VATADLDSRVRAAAFEFLEEQTRLHGEVLSREILSRGFDFNRTRVPLVGPQGIFKPAMTEVPLTITTAPIVEGRERPTASRFASCTTRRSTVICSV
jgi:putative restriction endonuclease